MGRVTPEDADLTRNGGTGGEAIGQRIIVTGRVLDEQGAPVPNTLIEVWQANSAGRYLHKNDQWPGPLDPNFLGIGRCLTDAEGNYRFLTIKPGAYPWRNHPNAWRPAPPKICRGRATRSACSPGISLRSSPPRWWRGCAGP